MERLRIPSKIKMQQLINRYPVDHIKGFHKDKVYWICDSIYLLMSRLDDKHQYRGKHVEYYVPLWSKILKDILGNEYSLIMQWMVKSEILKRDNHYIEGEKPYCYRFTQTYLDCEERWATVTYQPLKKSIANYESKQKLYTNKKVVKNLAKMLRDGKLTINLEGATSMIDRILAERYPVIRNGTDADTLKRRIDATQLRISLMGPVEAIHRGKLKITQDKFGYRIHTPITQLKKELRQFVKYDGKALVELDLSNSQLFFLNFLINYRNWSMERGNDRQNNILRELFRGINRSNYKYIITFLKKLENQYGKGLQDHPFVQHSSNGEIYNRLVEELNGKNFFRFGMTSDEKRKKVKKLLLQLLFANPNADQKKEEKHMFNGNSGKVWLSFKELYPEVVKLIEFVKSKGHKDICKLLQRIESSSILKEVCAPIIKEHPGVPIFTLHDCLITTVENKMLLQQTMVTNIARFIGFKPHVKADYWNIDNIPRETAKEAA